MSLSVPQSGDKSRFPEVRQPPPHGRGSANLTEPRPSGSDPSISQGHADQSRTEWIPTEHIYVEVLIGFDVKPANLPCFPFSSPRLRSLRLSVKQFWVRGKHNRLELAEGFEPTTL